MRRRVIAFVVTALCALGAVGNLTDLHYGDAVMAAVLAVCALGWAAVESKRARDIQAAALIARADAPIRW